MKTSTILLAATALVFTLTGAWLGAKHAAPAIPPSPAVASLFSKTLTDSSGKSQTLSVWQGKKLVVNFWAPWCKPCIEEMPELSALQTSIADKNVQVIGIGIDSAANIAEFSKKLTITYPIYVAGMAGTELASTLGNQVGGLPFTVLISADGQIKKTYTGRLHFEELRKDLASP
jgi:thiol-disulfide isomerase/thioredoxin